MLYLHPVHGDFCFDGKANAFQYFLVLGQSSLKKTFGGKRLYCLQMRNFFSLFCGKLILEFHAPLHSCLTTHLIYLF